MSTPRYADVEPGTALPTREFELGRWDLVRYAGASGDFNPIHWNQLAARDASLPDVVAHGMLIMGLAVRSVTEWAGGPNAVAEYRVRFRRPVPVPDGGRTTVIVHGVLKEKLADRRVLVQLSVLCGTTKVLTSAKVVARLG